LRLGIDDRARQILRAERGGGDPPSGLLRIALQAITERLEPTRLGAQLQLRLLPGSEGDQCLVLQSAQAKEALLRHCSYGLIQTASFSVNREGTAAALAVQPTESWRELWLLRLTPQGWRLDVLPPVAANPGLGYAEFAGWVPGGQQLLMVREARAEGRYTPRSFELLDLQTLQVLRRSGEAQQLGPFQRWADAGWKTGSLSLR